MSSELTLKMQSDSVCPRCKSKDYKAYTELLPMWQDKHTAVIPVVCLRCQFHFSLEVSFGK